MKPEYFDQSEVLEGLHTAMLFGAPVTEADRATFFIRQPDAGLVPVDEEGVPLVISDRITPGYEQVQVPCAVEFVDGRESSETFGVVQASEVVLTILGPDYALIQGEDQQGFEYVVIGGQKYLYRMTEAVIALGNIDVWTVHCKSEDEL